jgi:hypothetical protein
MGMTAAERQRARRRRDRIDVLPLRVDLPSHVIEAAIDRGELPAEDPTDREALSILVLRALLSLDRK